MLLCSRAAAVSGSLAHVVHSVVAHRGHKQRAQPQRERQRAAEGIVRIRALKGSFVSGLQTMQLISTLERT